MSIFHVNNRVPLLVAGEASQTYPQRAEIVIDIAPEDAFGVAATPRVFALKGPEAVVLKDDDEGIVSFVSEMIPRVSGNWSYDKLKLHLDGNRLSAGFEVASFTQAVSGAMPFVSVLPPLISLRLQAFFWIKAMSLEVGSAKWRMVVPEGRRLVPATTARATLQTLQIATRQLAVLEESDNPIISALYYYRQARRIQELQPEQVACVPETVLNLAKAVEILFGGSRTKVRKQGKALGLSEIDIEEVLIPILLIHNQMDIAHAAFGPLTRAERNVVISFCNRATRDMNAILRKVLTAALAGKWKPGAASSKLGNERRELIEALQRYEGRATKLPGLTVR